MKQKNQTKMRCLPIAAVLLALPLAASAQSVVSSGGGEGSAGSHFMSWTVGQPVTKTVTTGGSTLTQGFQQPWADITTVVGEHTGTGMNIRAYPNPTSHLLFIEMPGATDRHSFELLDAAGRIALQAPANGELTQLDLTGYSSGNYFLRARNAEGNLAKTFKITINH